MKETANHTLCYSGSDLLIRGYTDADWASLRNYRKSISYYALLLNDSAISWKSKKKICTTLSIMGSKFVACAFAIQ